MKLDVGTYNICHGEGLDKVIDVDRQGNFIKSNDLDLVFLQEIDVNTDRARFNEIKKIANISELNNYFFGNNEEFHGGYYGNGIISKYELQESKNYLMSVNDNHEMRGICYSKIVIDEKILNLYSVHLPVYKEERIKYIDKLIDLIKEKQNELIIVGGDFNTGIEKIGDHQYIYINEDSFIEYEMLKEYLVKLDNNVITWRSKTGQGCLDTIFYSKDFKLIKYETVENNCSDHSLIKVSLEV